MLEVRSGAVGDAADRGWAGRSLEWVLQALLLVTAVCALVPFAPLMPGQSLDDSWVYGINQAVAQGLAIGRDIVFTVGPYASIYTGGYHPGTDHSDGVRWPLSGLVLRPGTHPGHEGASLVSAGGPVGRARRPDAFARCAVPRVPAAGRRLLLPIGPRVRRQRPRPSLDDPPHGDPVPAVRVAGSHQGHLPDARPGRGGAGRDAVPDGRALGAGGRGRGIARRFDAGVLAARRAVGCWICRNISRPSSKCLQAIRRPWRSPVPCGRSSTS